MRTRLPWVFAFISGVAVSIAALGGSANNLVVSWSEKCPASKKLTVELLVDGQRKYRKTISICQIERNTLPGGTMSTTLQTERSHFGEPRLTLLEAVFWEAGADPDALVLGVSFASKERVWLNSLHVAFPDKEARTELAPGVSIKSYPTVSAEPPNTSLERTRER